jgi:hypothetical protein
MLHLLLSILLAAPAAQTREPKPAEPARVASAVAALKTAFEKGKPEERAAAIVAQQEVVEPSVLAWFAKGLKDSDATVRDAAAEALRFARHPAALAALEEALKRERRSGKDVDWLTKLTKCVGQHQSASSVPLFAENAFQPQVAKLIEARILALANTRSRQGLDELIGLMRTVGREKLQPYMPNMRLALMVVTGVDKGVSQDAWMAWWNDNKAKFEIPEEMPALPKDLLTRWSYFWGLDVVRDRPKKRGERGDDPEAGG